MIITNNASKERREGNVVTTGEMETATADDFNIFGNGCGRRN